MTVYTNANIDTLAAAVPGPYGPLTRVSDLDTDYKFDDNGDVHLEFTSAVSSTPVFATRNQLADADRLSQILVNAHSGSGVNGGLDAIYNVVSSVAAYLKAAALPYTAQDRATVFTMLRSVMPLVGMHTSAPLTWNPGGGVTVSAVMSGAVKAWTATITVTGAPSSVIVDWGDGTSDVGASPLVPMLHNYVAAGAKTIRITAVGKNGVAETTKTVTAT